MNFLTIEGTRSRPQISTQFQRLGGRVMPGNPDIRQVAEGIRFQREQNERRAEVNARNIWNQGETLTFSGRVKFNQNIPTSGYVTQFKENYNGTSEGNLLGSVRVQNGRLSILGLSGSVAIRPNQWIDYRVVATRDRNNKGTLTGFLNGRRVGVLNNATFGRRNEAHNVKFGLYGGANRTSQTQVVYHDEVSARVDSLTGAGRSQPLVGNSAPVSPVRSPNNGAEVHRISRSSPLIIDTFDNNDVLEINARQFNIARGDIGDRFTFGNSAQDSLDRFIFNRQNGNLFFDRDGSGRRYGQQLIASIDRGVVDRGDIRIV